MPNYLELGAKTLFKRMNEYGGTVIQYRRGSTMLRFKAVPGRVITQAQDQDGVILRMITRDYVIDRKALATLDPPHPLRNDVITSDDIKEQFIVNGEDLFNSHYEEADSYGVAWRVHTRRDKSYG